MVIINVCKPLGIFNGKLGTFRGFVYAEGKYPPELPEAVIIEFDSLTLIPPEFSYNNIPNYVLIKPEVRNAESNSQ